MYVILTYDIAAKRNSKILKICRKYLQHVQKSVFEGDISEAKLKSLGKELEKQICIDEDRICIYRFASLRYASKMQIGINSSKDSFL